MLQRKPRSLDCTLLAAAAAGLAFVAVALAAPTASAGEAASPAKAAAGPADKAGWKSMFDGKTLNGWKVAQFGGEAKAAVKDGAIVIDRGDTMSGVAWTGELPKNNYEVKFEAKRIDGIDFFCSTTFPVGDSPCTFVVGGWGGTIVGLSSIDGFDASENPTTKFKEFKQNQWYRIRIRVTEAKIEAWIDDEKMVDQPIKGHKISIRWECQPCKPFGFANWCTSGSAREIRIRDLTSDEVKEIAATVEDEQ